MFYPRLVYQQLKSHLNSLDITVLTGMRRTGKTYIISQLYNESDFENKVIIDLENPINREIFEPIDYEESWENLKQAYGLKEKGKTAVFLDEIQHVKKIPSFIKYISDHHRVKFIVTGSSSYYLKNLFSESLSGRKRIFELFPLTFDEFLVFKGKREKLNENIFLDGKKSDYWQKKYALLFDEYLEFGGFPKVVLAKTEEDKKYQLKDVLYSYIEQDVKELAEFKKIADLQNLIKLLAGRIGQKVDISKISREISLARQTVLEYISFLEKTYVVFLIKPFTKNPDREISKAPKLYFCDNGLANILMPVSYGQMLENAVFHAICVKYQPEKAYEEIHYYQKKSGQEIDFILGNKTALEVKETATGFDEKRLAAFSSELKLTNHLLVSSKLTKADHVIYSSQL